MLPGTEIVERVDQAMQTRRAWGVEGVDATQLNGGKEHIYTMNVVQPGPGTSVETGQDEYVISVRDLLGVLWRRLWVILLVTVLLTGSAVGFDLLRTPTYEATIKILVGQKQDSGVPSSLGSDVVGLQQFTQTMAELVPTRRVAEAVIDRLNLGLSEEELLENLSVEQIPETQSIEVSYEDESPEKAKQIADTVGKVFSTQVSEVSPSANAITATVWDEAAVPDSPASPSPLRDGLLALVLGGMLGVGLAFLLEQLDDRWRSPEEVEQVSGAPTFGVLPEFKVPKAKKGVSWLPRFLQKRERQNEASGDLSGQLVTIADPGGAASEACRTLRTSLFYALVDTPPKAIVVTSPGTGEGKSTTCANLAVVLAQAGKNTLVMDCDLRKPVMHKVFGLRNFYGVVNALVDEEDLPESWWQEPISGLKVATAGSVPPNPAELLGSRRFAHLLGRAREEFDYVLIDAPPIGPVSDPAILAAQGDGVLLVLDSQNTRKGALREAVRNMESVGARVLGTVMNKAKIQKGGYYDYSYK